MVFSHLLARESPVGVDIGSSSIKIVRAEPTKQGPRVSQVAICPTPANSIKEGVVNDVAEVASAIQFAMRSAGIKASGAIAAIAGPGVIVRHVQVPKMTEATLRKSIRFEAAKFISSPIEDSIVEFDILGDADQDDQMNIVLVTAPRMMVETKLSVLEQAGLEPLAVDVEAFALLRALQDPGCSEIPTEGTVALLDMGASHTEINLINKGELALTRTIPIAGVSLSAAIKNAKGCADVEAEEMKHSVNLGNLLEAARENEDESVAKAVQPLVDELLREIRRSINFYQSQLPEGTDTGIDALILTGGTARLQGLGAYTKSRLNVPVVIGSPGLANVFDFSSAPKSLSADDVPLLMVGFGLATKDLVEAGAVPAAA